MNKNRTNLLLIGILVSLLIATAGLIWAQDVENTKSRIIKKSYQKSMKSLAVKNDLQKYGIEVIPSSDFNFNAELIKHIGGNKDLIPLVDAAIPFAFFIKNNSSKEIVGVSLRWKFSGSAEANLEIPQSEANPGVLLGMKPLDPRMVGQTSLINKKEVKFFSYFSDIIGSEIALANLRFKNPSINYPYSVDSQAHISNLNYQREKILSNYTDFSVFIDGIVFDDGTFTGPDQNFFFDTLRADIEARKDILTALQEAKSSGKKDADILDDILSKTSNISVNTEVLRTGNPTREQVFDFTYKNYLKNFRSELMMKRTMLSDDYIIKQMQSVQLSDIVTLHKIED